MNRRTFFRRAADEFLPTVVDFARNPSEQGNSGEFHFGKFSTSARHKSTGAGAGLIGLNSVHADDGAIANRTHHPRLKRGRRTMSAAPVRFVRSSSQFLKWRCKAAARNQK